MCLLTLQKTFSCKFWMWEEDYEVYVRDTRVVGMRSDPEHEDNIPIASLAQFDNEIRKLKNQIVALEEKIILLLVINVVAMIIILIVIMCK